MGEGPTALERHLERLLIWRSFPGVRDGHWREFSLLVCSFPFPPHWRESEAIFTIAANVYLELLIDLCVCVSPFCENVLVPSKPVL